MIEVYCQSLVFLLACRSLFSCYPHLHFWAGAVVLIWHSALTSKAFSLDSSAILQPQPPPPPLTPHPPPPLTSQPLIGLCLVLTFSQRRWRGPDEEIRIPFIWIRVPHVLFIRKPIHSTDWTERIANLAPGSSLLRIHVQLSIADMTHFTETAVWDGMGWKVCIAGI